MVPLLNMDTAEAAILLAGAIGEELGENLRSPAFQQMGQLFARGDHVLFITLHLESAASTIR